VPAAGRDVGDGKQSELRQVLGELEELRTMLKNIGA
jgi:hypothetical protein